MKVLFLINDAFGIGGTITTTFNLAGALAARGHEVEVLSTLRRRDVPQLPLDPAVKLMSLTEHRTGHPDYDRADPLRGKPARYYPAADYRAHDYDKMVEDRYERYLRTSDADVVIATRAGLIAYLGRFAPDRMIRIGQEHLTRVQQRKAVRDELPKHINRLDAFVTVTARDAEDYRRYLNLNRVKLAFIPNSVPVPTVPASHGRAKLVVAAGRLVESKRYDVLIRAFAKVAAKRPDWQLRIYGQGKLKDELRQLVVELGLHNHVLMMGPYTPIETEWAKGAIAAVPSDREPFGMTLVEAMRVGVPVVSTDAPYGPAEILEDGIDGLLVPTGDPEVMGDALLRLIDDREERATMAGAALKSSERFDPAPIAERYEALFEQLAAGKSERKPWWSRLRRTPTTMVPPPVLGPAPTETLATATGEVTAGGDLVLRPGSAIAPGTALLWRRLGAGADEEVALDGLTVRLGDVPDGAWQLYCASGELVHAGSLDTRALMELPVPEHGGVRVNLPYRLADGGLGLRVWSRPVHAEVGDIQVDDEGIHVDGRLIGALLQGEPVLELRGPKGAIVQHTARALTPATFRADIPAAALTPGTWRLWLCYAEDAAPVRLGRFLDDVIRKYTAYVLPAAGALQPHFEGSNELSVKVVAAS